MTSKCFFVLLLTVITVVVVDLPVLAASKIVLPARYKNHQILSVPASSSSRRFQSLSSDSNMDYNVDCGNGGWCPTGAPICCGGSGKRYCVSAGDKCCHPDTPNPPDILLESCDQNQVCCPATASCCGAGSSCLASNQTCAADPCSNMTDPGVCLTQGKCGWCCSDHRCVSVPSTIDFATPKRYCKSGTILLSLNDQCADTCSYESTCNMCTSRSECTWCCSTQSCVSANSSRTNANDRCSESAKIPSATLCGACEAGGQGIYVFQPVGITPTQIMLLLLCLGVGSLACCFLAVLRMVFNRRRAEQQWAGPINPDTGMHDEESEVASRVRRYETQDLTLDEAPQTVDAVPVSSSVRQRLSSAKCRNCAVALDKSTSSPTDGAFHLVLFPCGHHICSKCCAVQSNENHRTELIGADPPKKCPSCGVEIEEVLAPSKVRL